MASSVRIVIDKKGVGEYLKSQTVADAIQQVMDPIVAAAGPGHASRVYLGKDRVRGQIWTGTYAAKKAEADDRNLTRSIDAGRIS